MKISAVIPAQNEMNSVGDVVRICRRYCDEVLVVDDGSTDRTCAFSSAAGATVIRNKTSKGIVKSTEIGLRAASGDIIVTLDADGQHDPSEIPTLVQPIVQGLADLVLGRRDHGRPLSELVISEISSLRVKCDDVGSGYRAFRRCLAHSVRLWGFCLCGSLVLEAQRAGARIVEVPINVRPRMYGRSHWSSPLSRGTTHFKQVILLLREVCKGIPREGMGKNVLRSRGPTKQKVD